MAKIIRTGDYIEKKKKKAITNTLLWALLMIAVFSVGLFLNHGDKKSYFSIAAAVMTLPIAQNFVGIVALICKKRLHTEYDGRVTALNESASVFMNNIAVTQKSNLFVNYIIAAGAAIYVFIDSNAAGNETLDNMLKLWTKKGIDCPIITVDYPDWDNTLSDIESFKACEVDEFNISAVEKLIL